MKIGILGGGQLGMMLAQAGTKLGHQFFVLSPDAESPAKNFSNFLLGNPEDAQILQAFSKSLDVLTYELEHLPVQALKNAGKLPPIAPSLEALRIGQDRFLEKSFFKKHAIGTAKFEYLENEKDLESKLKNLGFPCVLKTTRQGYDGKGQAVVHSLEEARQEFKKLNPHPILAEEWLNFDRELSIISVRNQKGEISYYPLTENKHKNGILFYSVAPAPRVSADLEKKAQTIAKRILEAFGYVGVLAIELFQVGDQLLANELAPRVHNSGHWTIEGAGCSQFENHIRAITGMDLGKTQTHKPIAMFNLVGEMPGASLFDSNPEWILHDYKKKPRPGRKLGHFTFTAETHADLEKKVSRAASLIRWS